MSRVLTPDEAAEQLEGRTPAEALSDGDAALIDRYLRFRGTRLEDNSESAYRGDLSDFAFSLNGIGLLAATADDAAAWFRSRTRDPRKAADPRPWSVRTAHRKRSSLSGFYDWAIREELVDRNPVAHLELKRIQTEVPDRVPRKEIVQLFDYLEHRIITAEERQAKLYILDAAIFRLCYNLALRVSEASNLRTGHVIRRRDGLYVRIVKKGSKTKIYPLTGVVLDAYERWMHVRGDVAIEPGHERWVFVHPWFGGRVSRKRAWERIQLVAAEAGLPDETLRNLTPHTLRHARAYHALEDGEPLNAVQSILDHANISTTSIYVADDERARIEALKRSSRRDG